MTQVGRLHTRLVLLQDGDDLGMPLALHPPQARDQRGKLSYNWKAKYTNEMRRDRESARANARMKPIETLRIILFSRHTNAEVGLRCAPSPIPAF